MGRLPEMQLFVSVTYMCVCACVLVGNMSQQEKLGFLWVLKNSHSKFALKKIKVN